MLLLFFLNGPMIVASKRAFYLYNLSQIFDFRVFILTRQRYPPLLLILMEDAAFDQIDTGVGPPKDSLESIKVREFNSFFIMQCYYL